MTDEVDPNIAALRQIERQLYDLQRGQNAISRRIPGPMSIGCGVMLGMVFFGTLGVVVTVLFWSGIIGALSAAAGGTSSGQRSPGTVPNQAAPR